MRTSVAASGRAAGDWHNPRHDVPGPAADGDALRRLQRRAPGLEHHSGAEFSLVSLRVLVASADPASGITQIRVAEPLRALLKRNDGELRLEAYPFVGHADLCRARVLVAQRGMARRHWSLMRWMQERGGAVVYELDDLLIDPAPHLMHGSVIQRAQHWVRRCLDLADLVTVSTQRLAEALSLPAERCRIVPNSALVREDRPLPGADPAAPVTLLFAASDHLAGDGLLPALRALQAERGTRVQVVGIGVAAADLAAAGIELRRVALLPRPRFAQMVSELPNVVGVIPLDASRFSACKSAIKWFDYAEVGVPTLASDLPPYQDVIQHDVTGALVAGDEVAWGRALRRAIDEPAWRTRIAQAARAEVRQRHAFEGTVQAWALALDAAQEAAARRSKTPSLGLWLGDLSRRADGLLIALRRANRERLARRRVRDAES